MSRSIDITFDKTADGFKIWIFAEELSVVLNRSDHPGLGSLPMAQADAVKDHLRITGIRTRHVRRCIALVEELLDKHFLREQATVTRSD